MKRITHGIVLLKGEKVSRCDTIVFCFMNNVSWRKEWLSIWIP